MQVVYTGPHQGVVIDKCEIEAQRDVPVTVPDDVGARLVQQETWNEAKPAKAQAVKQDKE